MTQKHTSNQIQKKPNDFEKNMATKKQNGKAEWINNMTKELEAFEDVPKAEIHIDLLKTTLEKYQTGKRQAMMERWFLVQEIHLHSQQTSTRNEQMFTRSTSTWMDD